MPIELDTAEIPVEVTGLAAAQQALEALVAGGEQAGESTVAQPAAADLLPAVAGGAGQAGVSSFPLDLSGVVAAIQRSNEILERILAAAENRPPPPPPTY